MTYFLIIHLCIIDNNYAPLLLHEFCVKQGTKQCHEFRDNKQGSFKAAPLCHLRKNYRNGAKKLQPCGRRAQTIFRIIFCSKSAPRVPLILMNAAIGSPECCLHLDTA